ncbi:acylpyruvate hydrolase [Bradyrhizobium diazoefficiens]|uniref:fumarylacetoacetate hydrolase family protein n=1 Tax=Bradyrhizobium diazoefficiens TaxID=1355477 RepID=UPI00351850A4
MQLATFLKDGRWQPGLRRGDAIAEISASGEVNDIIGRYMDGQTLPEGKVHALNDVRLGVPVPYPGKIVCMGLNYREHAKEGGNVIPDYPAIFLRAASSLIAPDEPLIIPKCSPQLDYEAELAIVIGRTIRNATQRDALAAVFGYACFNDGSVRNYQRKSTQWTIGKNFDGTGAFGPWIVTADELPPGAHGLSIRCRLNGQTMQDGNTGDMIFSVARTVEIISEAMTLRPGDVIITGTPAGVGYARKPPVFLKPGDVSEVEIEGIGVLRNPVANA